MFFLFFIKDTKFWQRVGVFVQNMLKSMGVNVFFVQKDVSDYQFWTYE